MPYNLLSGVSVIVGLLMVLNPIFAEEIDTQEMEAISKLLERHDQTLASQDLTGIMETYSSDSTGYKAVLMGTGPGERWVGQEEIREAYENFFKDFDAGALERHCTWRFGDIRGDTAWLMSMCQMTDYLKNVKREYALNVSVVMVKEQGQWLFQAMHFSNLAD